MLSILAVGGHIGDMELTCGMALAKHSLDGAKITTLALTPGEKGAPKDMTVEEYKKQKIGEANAFANMLGGKAIVFDYKDGELPDNDEVRFKVCDVIREVKPNILITHFESHMHKDHMATHNIVNDARFYAGISGFEREKEAFFANTLYYAENWEDAVDFKPYVYVDTTSGYELWKKAVATHWFVTGSKDFPYLEYYDHLSRVRGIEGRVGRAQTFMVPKTINKIVKKDLVW